MLTKPELAIDVDGQPFMPPPEVVGWRARRVDGPGRPQVAHDSMGRPIILPLTATFPDLYRAAGPGKYRLDPIDASGMVCPDVPVGCTGMMQPQRSGDEPNLEIGIGHTSIHSSQGRDIHELLIQTVHANTRMAEQVIHGIPAILSASGGLITAADGAKLTTRLPPLLPPPDPDEDEGADEDESEQQDERKSGMPAWLDMLTRHVVDAVVTHVKGAFAGMPLTALFDWSKAQQPAAGSASFAAHAAPYVAHAAPVSHVPPWFTSAPSAPMSGEPSEPEWFTSSASTQHASDPRFAPRTSPPTPSPSAWPTPAAMPRAPMPDASVFTEPPSAPDVSMPDMSELPGSLHSTVSVPAADPPVSFTQPPDDVVTTAPMPEMPAVASSAPSERAPSAATPGASDAIAAPSALTPPLAMTPHRALPSMGSAPLLEADRPNVVSQGSSGSGLAVRNRRRANTDDSIPMSGHIAKIWQSLTAAEQERTQAIIAELTQQERMQWLLELATLSLPDAVARVRDVIRPRAPAPNRGPHGAQS